MSESIGSSDAMTGEVAKVNMAIGNTHLLIIV